METAAEMASLGHANVSRIATKKTLNPRQNTEEVYIWTAPPAATIHQP